VSIEPTYELLQARVFEHEQRVASFLLETEAKAGTPRRQFCVPWPRNIRLPRMYRPHTPTTAS
jgi:hypothetical protein